MSAVNRERVKELLSQASRLPRQEREAFIRRAAGSDVESAAEAIDLLSTLDDTEFMSNPTGAGIAAAIPHMNVPGEGPGTRIDRYKLLQLIGEGGFGSVFMAEQVEPVNRKVALKIIKAGMDTKQVIARFEAERQALALMDHPNIARVLDAGATQSGRLYFVMELVRGEPCTHYCDRERLPIRKRLELFRDVCNAVQHAHQKGIIHRDIKPSNVLVTVADGDPLPKVIDFGIAKATASRLTDKTLFTELHQLIGTPEYMSPEQAEVSGVDIDTRSDIYSLGVLLYELLVGSTPLERDRARSTPFAELQRLIREEEPVRPSLRMGTRSSIKELHVESGLCEKRDLDKSTSIDIAWRRRSEPAALNRLLRGDLDWIVLKCLEKDRRRRYATTNELADDVERYLSHQPVLAMPPSRRYRARKFVRRNRGPVLAATAISLALIAGTVVSLVFAKNAARRTKELEQVARFQETQFSSVNATTMGAKLRADLLEKVRQNAIRRGLPQSEVESRVSDLEIILAGSDFTGLATDSLEENVFNPALDAVEKQFSDQPLVRAFLLHSISTSLFKLGLYDSAYPPLKEALETRKRILGDEHSDTLNSMREIGSLLVLQGKAEEAEPYLVEAVEKCRRALGDERPETLASIHELAQLRMAQGDFGAAEPLFRQAREGSQRVVGEDDPQTLSSTSALGLLLQRQGRLTEAEPLFLESLQKRRVVLGEDHPDTLISINHMSVLYWSQGRMEEAEPYFREALERTRRVLGDEHPNTLSAMVDMGLFFRTQGRLAEAEALYREVLPKRRRLLGNDHPDTQTLVHNMGFLLQAQGKPAEAEAFCREALDTNRRILGADHPETLTSVNVMGLVLLAQGKLDEAAPLCREAFEKRQKLYGDEHSDTLIAMTNLGALLVAQDDPNAAIDLLQPSEQSARKVFTGGNAIRLARFLTPLGVARVAVGSFESAEANLTEASKILDNAKGTLMRDRTETWGGLVRLYDAWHSSQPDAGYDANATEWRGRLSSIQSSH